MTKMGLYSRLLKFWGLPNFGGLKPLLKWLCAWAWPACLVQKRKRKRRYKTEAREREKYFRMVSDSASWLCYRVRYETLIEMEMSLCQLLVHTPHVPNEGQFLKIKLKVERQQIKVGRIQECQRRDGCLGWTSHLKEAELWVLN